MMSALASYFKPSIFWIGRVEVGTQIADFITNKSDGETVLEIGSKSCDTAMLPFQNSFFNMSEKLKNKFQDLLTAQTT